MLPNSKLSFKLYVMLVITLLLIAGTTVYLSRSVTTEGTLRADKNIIPLNGPWKFTVGDNTQYSLPGYDDSGWEPVDLTAPPGAHDDDVGLSGFIPGWTAHGHPNYSGYAWYRLNVSADSLRVDSLVMAAPPAVDDAYQLFANGTLLGSAGDFSGAVPIIYSIRPRMFLLPQNKKKITIAFRVWMSAASLAPGAGGIHIAPALGEKTHLEKKYRFQWEQTIKGYIVEVVLPVMFILLATAVFLLSRKQTKSYGWFIAALVLLALVRLNQAVYYWFQIESGDVSTILGIAILRPLMLGSWLMAWREWFGLRQPKWLPKIIVTLTLLYMAVQAAGITWLSSTLIQTNYQVIADYLRLLLLALMVFIICLGALRQGARGLLVFAALVLLVIALFPGEVSALHVIPGIWFPYDVGVSRGQFFYAAFVLVMFVVLIHEDRKMKLE